MTARIATILTLASARAFATAANLPQLIFDRQPSAFIAESALVASTPLGRRFTICASRRWARFNDHKGQWLSDRKIQFEPYPTSWEGKPVTEDVTFNLPDASHNKTRSVITTQDGSEMIFEFHGTRK